jgi:hypothetical protein
VNGAIATTNLSICWMTKRMRLVWEHNNSFQFCNCQQGQILRCHISGGICLLLPQLRLLHWNTLNICKRAPGCFKISHCYHFLRLEFLDAFFWINNRLSRQEILHELHFESFTIDFRVEIEIISKILTLFDLQSETIEARCAIVQWLTMPW